MREKTRRKLGGIEAELRLRALGVGFCFALRLLGRGLVGAETAPVGSYPRGASPFGIEDMAGNVFEWCLDYFEPYKSKDRVNPRSVMTNNKRLYRGGSWKSRIPNLRTTARNHNTPDYRSNDVGFRVVCECEG